MSCPILTPTIVRFTSNGFWVWEKSQGAPLDKRGPLSMTFFFFGSVWTRVYALFSSYLLLFFFRQHYCFEPPIALFDLFFFWGSLQKNPIKIWGANPSLFTYDVFHLKRNIELDHRSIETDKARPTFKL
jgi:hypothetical protein